MKIFFFKPTINFDENYKKTTPEQNKYLCINKNIYTVNYVTLIEGDFEFKNCFKCVQNELYSHGKILYVTTQKQ